MLCADPRRVAHRCGLLSERSALLLRSTLGCLISEHTIVSVYRTVIYSYQSLNYGMECASDEQDLNIHILVIASYYVSFDQDAKHATGVAQRLSDWQNPGANVHSHFAQGGGAAESRIKLRCGDVLVVNTPRGATQLAALRRFLAEGFQTHLQFNTLLHQVCNFSKSLAMIGGRTQFDCRNYGVQ